MYYQQGDVIIRKVDYKIEGEKLDHLTLAEGDIPYYEKILDCGCHKVSNNGDIYSCLKQVSKKGVKGFKTEKTDEWKKLNLTVGKSGYYQVNIHGKVIRVNRLIAKEFLINDTNYPEVHHINGDKLNNNIKNLRWGNQKQNASDRELHGNTKHGSNNGMAKLNEEQASEIFAMNDSLNNIAKKYNVSKKLILLIKQKKIWKHIHNEIHDSIDDFSKTRPILAHGESGHTHSIVEGLGQLIMMDKIMHLQIFSEEAKLRHQEHNEIILPKGDYKIDIIREYDPFEDEIRQVQD